MERFVGAGSLAAVVAVLLAAAAGHLARPRGLRDALAAHQVLPARLATPAAAVVIVVELVLGVGGVVTVVIGRGTPVVLGAAVALFATYAAYTGYAVGSGRGGRPCGCAGSDVPLGLWVVVRAVALAVLAALAALLSPAALSAPATPAALSAPELAISGVAAATFALLLWQLPAAMRLPVAMRLPGRGTPA